MFTEFDKVRAKLQHPELVEFAIFLHDIIYVIGRKDNELKSAKVAKEWLRIMGADALTIRRVVRLITVATKHPKSPKARLTSDEKYMSDFDLYGFSLSWDTVLGQTRDVRREFSKFSDDDFRKGNGDFIMSMMRQPVYQTEHYKQYEKYAKDNMFMIMKNMDQVVMARPNDKRL
jgi:predicted metal-dependent HD superfamily phosphohydrolase